ncbi:MAG: TerB family tellurite resistance protein [Acidobacteriota bacterium]|nr:TerB family tellurite resistance protein [Acidobacteriota bacterium]MDH3524699.1 TerB family tellurite resistance protein [Acidobacteriota bacterium]
MSILTRLLGLAREESAATAAADTESVRKIASRLEALEPGRARFIAAFAYVLGRVAHADLDISPAESRAMEALVRERGGLPEDQALLVVEIAKSQNRLFGGTENFLVTREFAQIADREERLALLDCLFAVSAADGAVSVVEEEQVRAIARELGLTHQEYVAARARYSEQREVMKGFRSHSGARREDA